jgi:hypothetical protein
VLQVKVGKEGRYKKEGIDIEGGGIDIEGGDHEECTRRIQTTSRGGKESSVLLVFSLVFLFGLGVKRTNVIEGRKLAYESVGLLHGVR